MGRVQWSMAGYANHLISIVGVYVVACAPNRFSGHQKLTKADVYKTMGGRFGMRSRVPRLGGTYSGLGWHPVWVAPQGELVVGRLSLAPQMVWNRVRMCWGHFGGVGANAWRGKPWVL